VTPYYDHGGITIYHGDCRDVLPSLDAQPDLVLTDPPYGVGERTDRRSKGRGTNPNRTQSTLTNARKAWTTSNDFPAVHGDDEPFDPIHLLGFKRLVLWGANNFADRLPPSPSWIVWDKLDGLQGKRFVGVDDNGDLEMAWTNLGGPPRLIPHRWKGLLRASEAGERALHPTQKPVVLMSFILQWRTQPGDLVLDPYTGSGPVLRAAKDLGRRAMGVEIEERYCEIAANRLAQEVLAL
jgi:DNA modification methylase